MIKIYLKTISTWITKKRVRACDQIYKIHEERHLLQRLMQIQRSRSDSLPLLENIIRDFTLAVVPRSVFSPDGSLLIPSDKSSVMHAMECTKHAYVDNEDDPAACVEAHAGDEVQMKPLLTVNGEDFLESSGTKVMIIAAMG